MEADIITNNSNRYVIEANVKSYDRRLCKIEAKTEQKRWQNKIWGFKTWIIDYISTLKCREFKDSNKPPQKDITF